MTTAIAWHDERVVWGLTLRAFFFDPEQVDQWPTVRRLLPFLRVATPRLLVTESDAGLRNAEFGLLIAQPDALFAHGDGYIALEYKPNGGRGHAPDRWHEQVRLRAVLQALIAAIAVAGARHAPCAAVLRCHNVVYQIDPPAALLKALLVRVRLAQAYWGESRRVSATQLARYCEPFVEEHFGGPVPHARAFDGRARHARMLRR